MSTLALARAREAERLALEFPPGPERELHAQIAFLWREVAQIALARELSARRCPRTPPDNDS